jgi:hypothetical protein
MTVTTHCWESKPYKDGDTIVVECRDVECLGKDYYIFWRSIGAWISLSQDFAEALCAAFNYFNPGWDKVPSENTATQEE